ncbi:outer membrane protein OmpK [Vibrio parahaemolyticus]|uniref:Outer membrane protein OmpK n=7 Tax=Vibrio parahaemolyticus TaxID=670 RepID=OMPK_VIBPH|nr:MULTISPECIES: outer membrane protein OmpK [Vibrio]P51002.1 RecName: Full=Outer membrane protein OmpK; Flags: Precursor [Vibrio parahaemolyticus]EJG0939870.1 outer membrane protein OmpK [Vibrio parahaemolyticus O1]KCV76057.1 membrane protein [Vibrio parahaemolyticus VP49]AMG06678.1 outer membrane protein OmpK [Vibrio parahaemolyticus]ANQ55335.1 membrane protein [Vibrio parahaemolyticus]ANZ10827.1 outer membrane protein OmpK [Vibrio parahaemolyticus]
MRKSLLALSLLAATSAPVLAADYSDGDIHKNDYKWMQFNLMGAFNELPGFPDGSNHDYLEMEFGGRSGIFDLYGYVDVFNLASDPGSDKSGKEKIFMKFAPRMSLDAVTGKDLSFGPVQELYVSTLMEWGGASEVNSQKIGLGSDVMVPWLGKIGLNLYGTYDSNKKDWNGYQISTNWFKPFYFFENGSFISYQGYIDWQFGMKDEYSSSSYGGAMFNGIYWHSDRFAVGYGLKGYKNIYGIKEVNGVDSTGFGHYIAVTYKF